jgi:phage shock protein PspC (stress-responsive transcriptional regulator)
VKDKEMKSRSVARKPFKRILGENWVGGVCAGLAYAFGCPVLLVRIVVLICMLGPEIIFGWLGGFLFVVYLIVWALCPKWDEVPVDYYKRTK